ncbi:spore-associated protein A [Nonomuraea sp. NPDC004580]|uniref:spore-associated protein A n=1 Tax=Nonomuraea sp. NPDC004580 TaxID=3154552 RepID=UPI0033AB4C2C
MRRLNRAGVLALTSAAALAGSLFTSAPAQAASSPIAACGSSYHVIDKHSLGGATVYLLYNGKTNCVVTWRDKPSSKRVYLKALIHRERQPWKVDGGKFTTYAGPVKIDARGYCVQWGGDYGKKQWTSKFGHCGK